MKNIFLVGFGGHVTVVIESAILNNLKIDFIIDTYFKESYNEKILDIPNKPLSILDNKIDCDGFHVAIGDNDSRIKYANYIENLGYKLITIIDPRSTISKYSIICGGTYVNACAVINSKAEIGKNCIINTSAIIEHECVIGANTHICPGVKLGGRVTVGENTMIGLGAIVLPKLTIGSNVTIGAGSVVTKNVEDDCLLYGIPAKVKNKS